MNTRQIVMTIGLAVAVVVGIGFAKWKSSETRIHREQYDDGRFIPAEGLAVNPNRLQDSDFDAREDFRRLGKALDKYYAELGRYPDDPKWLIAYTAKWPAGENITDDTFTSPDIPRSDSGLNYKGLDYYRWAYRSTRADQQPHRPTRPGEPSTVLVWTDAYARRNRTVYRDGTYVDKPEGFFLTLWSDGSVRELPHDCQVGVGKKWDAVLHFAGEAGNPKDSLAHVIAPRGQWPAPQK